MQVKLEATPPISLAVWLPIGCQLRAERWLSALAGLDSGWLP